MQIGQTGRRGILSPGDRVQITDPKGKLFTVVLVRGGRFQSARGILNHDDVIGKPDGQVIDAGNGKTFQVIRPLLSDYVLSMPRGASIVYPKDAAQIVQMGDIFPGAVVVEAGVGSGALSMSLLGAVGQGGRLLSVEKRPEFAEIAKANVDLWFGGRHPAWTVQIGDVGEVLAGLAKHSVDRVVLDLLDPWEYVGQVADVLRPGGVLTLYVTTVPQLSRAAEDLRLAGLFTEPQIWESSIRPWHVEGLSVRPEHRMIGHTGFLITARRTAAGITDTEIADTENTGADITAAGVEDGGPLVHGLDRRPAKASMGKPGAWSSASIVWSDETVGLRTQSPKKTRRVLRDLQSRVNTWLGDGIGE